MACIFKFLNQYGQSRFQVNVHIWAPPEKMGARQHRGAPGHRKTDQAGEQRPLQSGSAHSDPPVFAPTPVSGLWHSLCSLPGMTFLQCPQGAWFPHSSTAGLHVFTQSPPYSLPLSTPTSLPTSLSSLTPSEVDLIYGPSPT